MVLHKKKYYGRAQLVLVAVGVSNCDGVSRGESLFSSTFFAQAESDNMVQMMISMSVCFILIF